MSSYTHPQDRLAALEWALNKAREEAKTDDLIRLNYVPALQELRDNAQRVVRGA